MLKIGFLNLANTPRDPVPLTGRKKEIASLINTSGAHLFFLSEAHRPIVEKDGTKVLWATFIKDLLALIPGFTEVGLIANNNTEMSHGISLIATPNISITTLHKVQLSTGGFGSCGALSTICDRQFLAVQFPLKKEDRMEAMSTVISEIKKNPGLIVLGDFNDFADEDINIDSYVSTVGYRSLVSRDIPTFATFPTDMLDMDKKAYVNAWLPVDGTSDKIHALSSLDRVLAPIGLSVNVDISDTGDKEKLVHLIEEYYNRPSDHFALVVSLDL